MRHVQNDEKVARPRRKFAFYHERVARPRKKFAGYHSFERPTRTKWREGCQIHRCDPSTPTEKEYIFRHFQKILTSSLSLQSFL